MNEHVVPMFRITRLDILEMFEKKLASIGPTRAELEKILAGSEGILLSSQRDGIENGMGYLTEVEAKARFLRDHLAPDDHWTVTAAQLIEIHASLAPVTVNMAQLKFAIEPGKQLQKDQHNFTQRQARW